MFTSSLGVALLMMMIKCGLLGSWANTTRSQMLSLKASMLGLRGWNLPDLRRFDFRHGSSGSRFFQVAK
jgi:hypothetical protein